MASIQTGVPDDAAVAVQLQHSLHLLSQQYPHSTGLVIALSGGLDSVALFDACVRFCDKNPQQYPAGLRAIHVHHGLSVNADAWQHYCQALCSDRGVALSCVSVSVANDSGLGIEAQARHSRYRAFSDQLAAHEVLLMAHHRDDQAETVLLRLLRGAGPGGLAGMPQHRTLGEAVLWRPFLEVSRAELQRYVAARQLRWVDDESNDDVSLSRNYLRHQVIPAIAGHWPDWQGSVLRSGMLGGDAEQLLQELAHDALQPLVSCNPGDADQLSLLWTPLVSMSLARQRLLIRHWLLQQTRQLPGWRLVQRIVHEMLAAAPDAQPQIAWDDWLLRRYRDRLYLNQADELLQQHVSQREQLPDMPHLGFAWLPQPDGRLPALVLPGNGAVRLFQTAQGGMRMPQGECFIRYRVGGERCALPGRPHRALKKILQESALPPWVRARTPLLYVNDELAWIAGVGVCEGFQSDGMGWAVAWQMPS